MNTDHCECGFGNSFIEEKILFFQSKEWQIPSPPALVLKSCVEEQAGCTLLKEATLEFSCTNTRRAFAVDVVLDKHL